MKIFTIILFFTSLSYSQITKNNWLVGGSGNFKTTKTEKLSDGTKPYDDRTIFSFSPNVGYFFYDKLAGGISLSYTYDNIYNQKYLEKQEFTQKESTPSTFIPNETNNVGNERTISSKSKTIRFDLNAADTTQLKLLPGIGSGYAKRIIAYRDKLGGFIEVEQVSETYQLSELAIQSITEQCFVQKEVRKIALNKVEKITHPYLTYAQANSLISYRKQHGSYKNEQDLRAIKTLNESTIQRILPYLSFD